MNPHDRTWVPMGMLPLFVGLCVPPVAVGAFFYFLHLKVTGETMWHSNHPIAIFGLLVTIGSSLVGGAIAVRLQRWLILRYGTEAQRQEQEFWDGRNRPCRHGQGAGDRDQASQRPLHTRKAGGAVITVDLKERPVTVEELLSMASSDSLLIVARNGHEYTLEEADDLEREARMLGQSEKFMDFLERRRQEPGSIPLEAIEEALQSSPGDEAQ